MANETENKVIVGDVTDSEITGDCITVSAEDMKSCNITGDYVTVFNEGSGTVNRVNGNNPDANGNVTISWTGTTAEWEALDKSGFNGKLQVNLTDGGVFSYDCDENTLTPIAKIADVVESGNMNAVTSNAVNAALAKHIYSGAWISTDPDVQKYLTEELKLPKGLYIVEVDVPKYENSIMPNTPIFISILNASNQHLRFFYTVNGFLSQNFILKLDSDERICVVNSGGSDQGEFSLTEKGGIFAVKLSD